MTSIDFSTENERRAIFHHHLSWTIYPKNGKIVTLCCGLVWYSEVGCRCIYHFFVLKYWIFENLNERPIEIEICNSHIWDDEIDEKIQNNKVFSINLTVPYYFKFMKNYIFCVFFNVLFFFLLQVRSPINISFRTKDVALVNILNYVWFLKF